jgi:prepilin-type N-terminal cleavage/methylation domain-containing protein
MRFLSIPLALLHRSTDRTDRGFTLTEVLVVIIIAGVLAGIAAPSWLTFVDRQRLTTVRSELLLKIKEAQAKSLRTKTLQVVQIDNPNPGVVRPTVSVLQATRRDDGINVDTATTDPNKKTLGGESNSAFSLEVIPTPPLTTRETVRFGYGGTIDSPTKSIAESGSPSAASVTNADNRSSLLMYRFKARANSTVSACLMIDTVIGAIREGTDEQCK